MIGVIDERPHAAALEAALTATVGAGRIFDYGMVPGADGNAGTLPPIYVLLSIARRYVQPTTAGRSAVTGWRVSCRYVGRTVAEARWAQMQVATALNEVRLSIGGATTTPITHESTTAIEPDDGMQSGLSSWTYAITS